ncbi:MAG: glycosyltransferase family 4 protein [Clostridia bacterium]|nr:glycosyltransferase family 4 protein [Clostridia bacterium]
MNKILYVASKVKLHINLFHIPFFVKLKERGSEVHVCAANDYLNKEECIIPGCDMFYDIPFHRIPVHPRNIKAYFKLKKIIDENNYDIIHCHTPIGGAATRLAARRARRRGSKVIYTAHGFHFYKGAPAINWILYYPVERILARFTDLIITINEEDYRRALSFKGTKVILVKGVGIDVARFSADYSAENMDIRRKLAIPDNGKILIFAGEMSHRKHQDFLIEAVAALNKEFECHLLLAGEGSYTDKYRKAAVECGILDKVHFLGFRTDIDKLMAISDIYISASRQEGLPVNIMEAMATGLPIVSFDIRGNNDLIVEGKGGYLVPPDDLGKFCRAIIDIVKDSEISRVMGEFNKTKIRDYDRNELVDEMMELYKKVLG